MTDTTPKLPAPLTYQNIGNFVPHEFIMVIGLAATGKSEAILKTAEYWQDEFPDKKFYCIDTENRLAKSFFLRYTHLRNFNLWHGEQTDSIHKFLNVFDALTPLIKEGDFLAIESDTRLWSLCQDEAWVEVTGQSKSEYLSDRMELPSDKRGKTPVTPMPDNLWQVAGNYYRRRYRQVLDSELRARCNVILTTGVSKPSDKGKIKISEAKKDTMELLNIDIVPDGHPEASRNPDTVVWLSKDKKGYHAKVLKDQSFDKPGEVRAFDVVSFYEDFIRECRSGK
jgi:hypothetical protein